MRSFDLKGLWRRNRGEVAPTFGCTFSIVEGLCLASCGGVLPCPTAAWPSWVLFNLVLNRDRDLSSPPSNFFKFFCRETDLPYVNQPV